jgi:hypothetical protein
MRGFAVFCVRVLKHRELSAINRHSSSRISKRCGGSGNGSNGEYVSNTARDIAVVRDKFKFSGGGGNRCSGSGSNGEYNSNSARDMAISRDKFKFSGGGGNATRSGATLHDYKLKATAARAVAFRQGGSPIPLAGRKTGSSIGGVLHHPLALLAAHITTATHPVCVCVCIYVVCVSRHTHTHTNTHNKQHTTHNTQTHTTHYVIDRVYTKDILKYICVCILSIFITY